MVAQTVKSAPDGTGVGKATIVAFHKMQLEIKKMEAMLYQHTIEKRCFRTGLDIESCSGCKEMHPQHLKSNSVPTHKPHGWVVAPHAHELPQALRDEVEEVITILIQM